MNNVEASGRARSSLAREILVGLIVVAALVGLSVVVGTWWERSAENDRAAGRRATVASLRQALEGRPWLASSFTPWLGTIVRVRSRLGPGGDLLVVYDLEVVMLRVYHPGARASSSQDGSLGARTTIALLDRDGDGLLDAYLQPAPTDLERTSALDDFVPLGNSEAQGLRKLWDIAIDHLAHPER